MADRRVWIIHCRWSMHEHRWADRRFDRITEINVAAEIVIELLRKRKGKFIEQIVRVLSIVERLIVPRLAALQKQRIATALLSQKIETHHRAQTKLSVFA